MVNLLYLDLELNQPSQKIFQLGWTIGNPYYGYAYLEKGRYVKLDEPLDDYVGTTLCGISELTLADAGNLEEAYQELLQDFKHYNCYGNICTWGGADGNWLKKQLPNDVEWPLGTHHYLDVKTVYQTWKIANENTDQLKGGLARAMTKLGMNFVGRKHNAQSDALNTFRIHTALVQQLKIKHDNTRKMR